MVVGKLKFPLLALLLGWKSLCLGDAVDHAHELIKQNSSLSVEKDVTQLDAAHANVLRLQIISQFNSVANTLENSAPSGVQLNIKEISTPPPVPVESQVKYLTFYPNKYSKDEVRVVGIISIKFSTNQEALAFAEKSKSSIKQIILAENSVFVNNDTLYVWFDARANSNRYTIDNNIQQLKQALSVDLGKALY